MTIATPHQSVMLQEAIEALNIIPEGVYIDATFGRGGHSHEILQRLNEHGRLFCLDKDPEAIAFGQHRFRDDKRVTFVHQCFGDLTTIAHDCGIATKVNGILLDLGVSSPQLDEASRGFSFMRDGPLDMRMDPTKGPSAKDWVNTASQEDIVYVLKKFGEESFAKRIARNIAEARTIKTIETTLELAHIVERCIPRQKIGRHPATKTFQAIRIHINRELQAIEQALAGAMRILAPGGRLVVISFHSLEDRMVKQFFNGQSKVKLPKGIALPEKDLKTPFKWVIKRQRPSEDEVNLNQRSRSATLRVAEKNTL